MAKHLATSTSLIVDMDGQVSHIPSERQSAVLSSPNVTRSGLPACAQFGADPIGVWSNPIGDWVADKDDMELRNTYMYGLDVLFHRCVLGVYICGSWPGFALQTPAVMSSTLSVTGQQGRIANPIGPDPTSGAMRAALRCWCTAAESDDGGRQLM